MERSLLSSNHPEKQFDVKLPMAGKVFALVCLFALSTQFALAQNKIAVNALPTGGNVVAGAATISSTSTAKSATMNINQTSQRAVINWQTFNVGKNATVNFNQPNSGSVTLNRVVSATPSMIQGAINANGQVILVNPNGVTFGKGAQVNAAGVVASTLNISNQDFMNGKNIYSGNGEGKIVNKGTITATDPNGYIALLAPEIRNQGYLIARMGPSSTVALASGEKISLDFRGTQLIGVSIDKAAYKALIENKRIIETNGGVIIVAAGTARELMSSVIQNTGRISANSIVDNGGVIELVADNVTNSGSISANGGTNGVGGQVNIVGNNITLAANSQTTATGNLGGGSIQVGVGKTVATNTTPASAVNGNANTAAAPQTAAQILASNTQGVGTQAQTVSVEQGAVVDASAINSGNGGAIVIWSQVKTTVNGILKAVGGYLNGNGGLIETSSAGLVSLGKSLSIDTSSSKGSAGLWYVDPIDLTIDGASSAVISAALVNNNVSITVAGNTCPSLGSCTQNGSGNLTIASGADIIKQSGSLTTLTLTASGVFNLNANISGQNLDVIINSSIAYLNAGSTITANQVTVQAQTIYSYGNINSGSLSNLGSAIQLLGSALYISGNLTVGANLANSSNSTSSNSNTVSYNGTLIRQEDLPTYLAAANQTTLNLDQVYATTAANQANFTTAVNNQITLTGTESISIAATAQLLANGTTGGVIMATAPQINLVTTSNSSPSSGSQSIQGNGSLIQANGNNGPGGTISFTAANDFNINVATISASGSTDGGSIRLISSGGNLLMANSLIQTNGGTGRGGSLGVSGANSTTINSSTLEATGFSKGGSIMVGYDSAGKSIPFSQSTTIDASTILNANQTDGTNTTGGGLIETSGGTLTQLASINAGRGGMWLLDPYDYIIGANEAAAIVAVLNSRSNVTISTSAASSNGINANSGNNGTGTISVISDIVEPTQNGGGSELLTLDAGTQKIYLSANINTRGGVNFSSPVVLRRNTVTLSSDVNYMNFASTVDGDPGFQMASLVINSSAIFNGNVGSTTPLANLKVTGITQIYGDITVYGGSSNQFYGTNAAIYLTGAVTLRGNAQVRSIGDSGIAFLSSVATGEYLPASTNGNTHLTVGAGAGDIYFGNTVNLTGSLTTTAGTTYLGGNVSTTGSQTYNSNVVVMSAYTQIQPNGNLTITGTLAGSYYANSPIFLFANGAYGGSNTGQLSIGQSVSLSGGTLTYMGGTSSQTTYTWTPLYDAVGAVLAVGGGSGGAGGYAGGTGGNGGSVIINRMVEFTPNSTYTLSVGNGGAGGGLYSAGGNGGDTSVMLGGTSWITATGGICCSAAGNGGANPALPNPPYGYVPGNGIQAFSLLGMGNNSGVVAGFTSIHTYQSGASTYTQVINGSNGTYFGAGANNGSTGSNLAGLPADTNTGSGGGGGAHLANGMMNAGGDGASGVLMFNQVSSGTTSVDINVTSSGRVSIGAISGKTNGTINGYSISDGNGGYVLGSSLSNVGISAGSSSNIVSGDIQGGVALSYAGLTPTSKLLLAGNNTTSAGITVYVGTLVAGSATAFGGNGNLVSIGSANSAIDLNGQSLSGSVLSIAGTGINSNGALINSNPSTPASFSGALNLTGGAYIGGPGAIVFGGVVNTSGRDLSFVNSASVNASNSDNQISTISGSNAGNVTLVSKTLLTVGAANSLSGFLGQSGNLSFYGLAGVLVNNNIVAQSIYLFGRASIGVEIQSATLHATNAGITIYGNGDFFGSGVYIGGTSLLITDSSSGNISISGYAPRLGVTFGGFGGSGGRTNTEATSTSPLAIDSANNISINGYADYTGTNGDILGINLNAGLSTAQYALLNARGNGSIYLSGAAPNCNCSSYTIGAAISVVNTPMNAANEITIGGAILNNMGVINGVTIGNVAGSSFGSGPLHVSSVMSNQYANGGFQPYGVNISNSSTVYYSGGTYGNTFAGGSISIFGSSSSGIGVNSASNFNSGAGSLEISATGNGNANAGAINIAGSITKSGAQAANITIASSYNVALGNITDSATAPIRIIAGNGIAAGTSSGGTITSLGTISLTAQSSRPTIGLSMAAPENSTCQTAGCIIEAAVGITAANANTSTNVAYNVAGGDFSNSSTRTGNFINYRYALTSNTYNVALNGDYSAVYGTAYNSTSANAWLQAHSSLVISGVTFGVTTSSAQSSLRFMSTIDGILSSNYVQSSAPITASSLYSIDGAVVNLTSSAHTYSITPASLTITANNDSKVYGSTTAATSGIAYSNGVYTGGSGITVSGLVSSIGNTGTADAVTGITLTTNGALAAATVSGGPYGITPSFATGNGLSSYNITYVSGTMNITPAQLSITAYNDSKVYGTSTTALRNITYTPIGTGANATGAATTTTGYSVAGLLNSDSVSGVTLSSNGGLATATVAGGPYAITPGVATGSGLSNYAIQYVNAVMQMTPASLTITASNDSKVYGATATSNNIGSYANGSITAIGSGFTVNGLLNSDSISRVILTSNGALATATVAGGPYSITPSTPTGVGLSNYSINYVNGSMSVTPAPLGISVTGVYNNSTTFAPSSFTTYGLVNGEVINTLSSATVAFKDVLTGNNYVTGLVISTGTASMNNYQLNPLGRNITQNSTLQNIATITPIEITVTGATAANKVYDGTTAAVVNTSGAILSGKISGDNLTLTMNSGSFMSPDVGTSISVSGAGSLQGSSASNYTLGATILMANITKAPLGVMVTGTYSNSTTITPTSFTTNGLVNGETIVTLTSAIVSNKNVAANGSNYVTSITKGNGTATLNNYAINTSYNASSGNTQNTATIDPKVLSVSGTAVADKVYNGTASATLTNGVLNGVNPGDSITLTQAGEFSQANVGTSITVVARDAISDSSGNYTLQQPQTLNASITPKLVTLSATKTYDATTSLTGVVTIGGLVGSETLNYTGATAYSANAGGVNFIAAMTLANGSNGGLASNYVLPSLGTFANAPVTITPKALNLSATKTYDATTNLASTITINGLIGSQTLNYSGATAHTANAGSTYIDAITITDGTGGGLASNYQLPTLTSAYTYNNVTITPKVVTLSANKVYDGTTGLAGAVTVGGLIGSQTLSYTGAIASDINVATSNKYILNIALSDGTNGGIATNYSLPASGLTAVTAPVTITPKALTVTGTTVPDKVYDGSTTTTLANGVLVGVVDKDIGSVTLNQSGTFASPNAGSNVAVVANDSLNLTAGAIGNYTLIQPTTTTGNITPKSLTVSGTTVANKVYDSTGDATLSGGSLVGLVTGDAAYVSLVQAGTFAQSNVGSAIAVTANNSLTGTKASNYALTQPTGLGADITPKSLGITVTGTYNGTNTIEVTSFTTTGLVAGEVMGSILSATVSDANVATPNKYVGSIAYITGNGARVLWMSNYSISQAYNSTVGSTQNIATITPIALTVTGTTVPNKVYDGSTATTLANGVLNGVISGQAVGLVQAGTFASPNAGNNVAVVASDSLSGNAAVLSNYTLVQPTTTTGNITPAPVTVNNTSVANKVYDGTNVATLTGGTLSGVIAGDAVNVTLNQSGAFANVNVGSGIAVTATDSLSGTKAANYTLTQPSVSAANITPAPLGISITNAVYQASTSLYPVGLNFTVTGLVHGETIATLGGATVANANVSANGSNYLTAITVGSGTASLSNYSLNPSYSSATNNMQNKVTLIPMVLTVTGTTVPDKVYDGTTTTTLAGGTLVGVFSTDRNNVSLNQSGTFASPNAGNNVAVVANDSLNLTASAVGNYTLIQPTTTTGNIIKALLGITVTGTYTGSTTLQASGIGFTVSGLLNNETINTLGAVTVSDKNVSANGSNYVTAITIGTGTASMNNYVLTQAYNAISGNTQNTATILTTQLTVVGTSSTTKVYDATNSATLTGGVLAGLKGSDTLTLNQLGTFSNTNVGNNLIITAADSISGTAAGNYTLIQPTGLTGSITPKALTVNGTSVPTKVYDGTTSVVFSNSATLVGVIGSDTVVLNQAGSFVSKNVGSGVAITINDSISGASASNYTLVQPTGVSANITPAPLGLTLTAVYSGSTTITPTSFTTNGLWNGDTITALSSATLSSANVSANASNYITSVTIGGGSALMSNYTINPAYNATPGNTLNTATITPKALTLSASKVYDGSTTGASVNISGLIGGQTLNYSDVRLSDQNVATANKYISAITLADGAGGGIASNYVPPSLSAASASNSVTITPLMVRLSANKEYDGTTSLTGKVTISGLVGSETLNYTGATAISPNVGANYINAIALADGTNGGLASNYQIPNLTLAYTNNNAQVTAKAISISATKVYDATADLTNAITITGLIGNQTLNYSGATANSANVLGASYINAITFTDGANGGLERNYIVPTLTGSNTNNSVSITAAPLSLSGTKIYDGSRTGGTGTLNIGGLIGAQTLSSSDVTVNDPNVGTDKYITAITLADGANGGITSNYALPNLTVASARNNGSITPRDLTITVSAQTKTYGDGIAQTSNTQDGSINLTPVSGHTSGTASNVDTRTTALSDIQYVNYTGNTANNSTAGFSVDGLVANDVVRTVNISSSGGALTANANVNGVLAYAITASGAVGTGLSNYNISYVANNYSVLTITPRKLVVTAATATMVYGASALPTLSTSSITGWANTADQAITSIALSAQDATGKLVKANIGGVAGSPVVGTYSVVATGVNGNPNYVIDTVNSTPGQFTITPASLTITANSLGGPGAPILYGTPTVLKPDAFTSSGLTNGDSLSTATITFNSATTVAGTTTPGIYTPVVSGPSSTGGLQISGASGPTFVASNYVINYVAGSLTISQAKLTVSAVNDAKLQGQQDANGYNGVIVSGFVNGDTLSVLNTTGLSITRNNAVNNTAPGTYNGVLIASGVSLADLNSTNYSIAYQPGNFTIVPPNQLLIKVAPVTTQYGSAIYTGSSPVTATYLTSLGSSPQSINALISGGGSNYQVNLGSGQSSASAPLVIGTAADISSSGNLNVGSYNLSPIAQQINLQGTGLTSAVAVGGISITPKTLSFADLGSVTLTKDYDGKASSTVPVPALSSTFLSGDNVTATASGTFTNLITGMPDANAGINKSYTIAVSFSPKLTTPGANQTDANNYVLTGGGIYTADGGTGINHGPANGVINVLDSVNYIGAASGAAWSSASSWANGAVPTYANVRNIIVPVGFSVVYDAGVAGPVAANLQNAGNVNFNTDMGLAISMNISGAGSITISGTGQVSLSGNNTYTGNAIINNGAKLVATYGNTIGAGNIQGLGGTFQTTPGTIFTQINATGSLILASDITTTGNQTYGNITFSQPRTTLLSQFGSITINGTVDSGTANVNTLLLQAPTGSVSLRGSVGSIKPLNVLEIDAVSTYLYADVLTADQQNYCGAAGCYTAITPAQVTASYCATNDCYSKNNDTSAYNLLASGTGGSGNFAKSANIGQLFIGDVGQVGFLYNKYNQYASKSVADGGFGTPTPLFNNNSVYARTLMSMDPTVNLGSYVSDVSVTPTHTIQVAAIQATGVTASPTIQMSGSGKTQSTSALYSLSALTQGATWAGTYSDSAPIEAANYIALGSKALNLNNASLTAPTLNLVYPPSGTLTTNASSSFTANNASINGRATTTIGGRSLTPYTPATPSPSGVTGARSLATPATPTTRNSFILAAVAEQTKIERKYDVDASVDVGEIETDDGPAAADDQDDKKKKKAGNQKAAQ
ncbi:filamentous hemagglutinin N-terminal domain-containing protein [Polynucleobacter paneuropaeus]|nr:filamentous hemagglutinin N-terminal domain-containing protein [Polynucleobacter paneuropaeus]